MTNPKPKQNNNALLYLSPLGGGIKDMAETGQHRRLLEDYFQNYATQFDRIYMQSYFDESLDQYPGIQIPAQVVLLSNPWRLHRYLFALLFPFLYRKELRQITIIRVSQSTGALSALACRLFRRARTPVVITYGYDYVLFASIRGFLPKKLAQLHEYLARLAADNWITTLPELRELIQKRHHAFFDKIWLIPNGLNFSKFSLARKPELNSGDLRHLIFVGRLEAQKRVDLLIEMLNGFVEEEKIPLSLSIVGEGSLRKNLEAIRTHSLLTAKFLGKVNHEELPELLAGSQAFCSATLFEGHPKAMLEAMGTGLPIVAFDGPGSRGFLQDSKQFLFKSQEQFSQALRSLRNPELRTTKGKLAQSYALATCDLAKNLAFETKLLSETAEQYKRFPNPSLIGFLLCPLVFFTFWIDHKLSRLSMHLMRLRMGAPGPIHPKNILHSASGSEPWFKDFLPAKGSHILDLGAGSGAFSQYLAKNGYRVTAIERDPKNIRLIESFRDQLQDPSALKLIKHDLESFPYPLDADSFDAVISSDVMEHLNHRAAHLQESSRVLRKSGVLFLAVPNRNTTWKKIRACSGLSPLSDEDHKIEYSQEELTQELVLGGFGQVVHQIPGVIDAPINGLIDLTGPFSMKVYKILMNGKEAILQVLPHESNGFRLVCQKTRESH